MSKRDRLEDSVEASLPLEDLRDFRRALAEAKAWSVTPSERRAVARYRAASKATNAALHEPLTPLPDRVGRRVELLDSALSKAPTLQTPLTVYRGERHPRTDLNDGYGIRTRWRTYEHVPQDREGLLDWAHARWPVGSEITSPGFTSFSATPAVAMRFTADEPSRPAVLLRAQTRVFAYPGLLRVPSMAREFDIIVPRGTRSTVTNVGLERIGRLPFWWGRPGMNNSRSKALSAFVMIDVELNL